MSIRLKENVVFGIFTPSPSGSAPLPAVPACRVVLTASFGAYQTSRKYERATITIHFQDGALARLDLGDDANEVAINEAMRFQPRIWWAFEPNRWWGEKTVRDGELNASASLGPGLSTLGPSPGLGLEGKKILVKSSRSMIKGDFTGPTNSEVWWSLTQNDVTNEGIIDYFSMAMAVGYTTGRPFVARVRVEAKVQGQVFGNMVSGMLDDPLNFRPPDRLDTGQTQDELNGDLKDLCDLDRRAGSFKET